MDFINEIHFYHFIFLAHQNTKIEDVIFFKTKNIIFQNKSSITGTEDLIKMTSLKLQIKRYP